jgi:hypothetical protein
MRMKAAVMAFLLVFSAGAQDKHLNFEQWHVLPASDQMKVLSACIKESAIKLGRQDSELGRKAISVFLSPEPGKPVPDAFAKVIDLLQRLGKLKKDYPKAEFSAIPVCEVVDEELGKKLGPAAEAILAPQYKQ